MVLVVSPGPWKNTGSKPSAMSLPQLNRRFDPEGGCELLFCFAFVRKRLLQRGKSRRKWRCRRMNRMQILKELTIYTCGIMLTCTIFSTMVTAGGPPLKDNACGTCHQDYNIIRPKMHPDVGKGEACTSCHAPDRGRNEATKFSSEVHKVHQCEKTKLECSACHSL